MSGSPTPFVDASSTTASTVNTSFDAEVKLSIIFSCIAAVAFVAILILVYYMRRTTRRQIERAEKELEKEKDRVRFEKQRERRKIIRPESDAQDKSVVDGGVTLPGRRTDVFAISPTIR